MTATKVAQAIIKRPAAPAVPTLAARPAARQFARFLRAFHACTEGYRSARGQTEAEFVRSTRRGDWLIWLLVRRFPSYEAAEAVATVNSQCRRKFRSDRVNLVYSGAWNQYCISKANYKFALGIVRREYRRLAKRYPMSGRPRPTV